MNSKILEFLRPGFVKIICFMIIFSASFLFLSKYESMNHPAHIINSREMILPGGLTGSTHIGFPMRVGEIINPTNSFEEDEDIVINFGIDLIFWYLVACFLVTNKYLQGLLHKRGRGEELQGSGQKISR